MQIIGAPAFFPTVWNWIKRWFDPVTTSKIFILSASEVEPTLSSFMDTSNFPTQYGGELEWQWGDMPNLDKPAKDIIGPIEHIGRMGDGKEPNEAKQEEGEEKAFVKGPVVCYDDRIEVLGSVDGKPRRRTIVSGMSESEKKELETPSPETNGATDSSVSSPANGDDKEKAALNTDKTEPNGSPVGPGKPISVS